MRQEEQKCDAALGERSYFIETALGVRAPPVCTRRVIVYPAHGRELSAVAGNKPCAGNTRNLSGDRWRATGERRLVLPKRSVTKAPREKNGAE